MVETAKATIRTDTLMLKKIPAALVAVAAIVALSACTLDTTSSNAAGNGKGNHGKAAKASKGDKPSAKPTKQAPSFTAAQEQAVSAAKSYLNIGTGFSRAGLLDQLTAQAGSGFKMADAVFAVNHTGADWNKQAVLAAKAYLNLGTGFSRSGLIDQLTAQAGSQFTLAQATYAANHVGL